MKNLIKYLCCLWYAVTAVFTLAYKLQPSIIFIDEVDSFLGQRRVTEHEALTNMKTEFMALWDGFTTDRNTPTSCSMLFILLSCPVRMSYIGFGETEVLIICWIRTILCFSFIHPVFFVAQRMRE